MVGQMASGCQISLYYAAFPPSIMIQSLMIHSGEKLFYILKIYNEI